MPKLKLVTMDCDFSAFLFGVQMTDVVNVKDDSEATAILTFVGPFRLAIVIGD